MAAADYDNDGWIDLFVTNYGRDLLYRNNGDGTFTEVGAAAGVAGDGIGARGRRSATTTETDGWTCTWRATWNSTSTTLPWEESSAATGAFRSCAVPRG